MKTQILGSIYNSSIKTLIDKFISSNNDFFLSEKDLHFYFFHSCLNENSFEYRDRFLIHTEYPMPFKVKKENIAKIVNDDEIAMRPHIDSILLNKKFIDWILNRDNSQKYIDNCIRGLGNDLFPKYIVAFRKTYDEFYKERNQSILSHSLEFKFIRGGYEGVIQPIKDIQYDLKKLYLIGYKNEKLSFSFSKKCTLLVFIGKRGGNRIIEKLKESSNKNRNLFGKFSNNIIYSKNKDRSVIYYDLNSVGRKSSKNNK